MKAFSLAVLASVASAYTPASSSQTDKLALAGLVKLAIYETHQSGAICDIKNAAIRQEWSLMNTTAKTKYINAVQCLNGLPSQVDPAEVPGARTRYDDFVAVHINQTLSIHGTANFLSWHRYFTYAFENALRTQCGYTGAFPYWNWAKSALDPIHSPYLDGSATSISGNGVFEKHNATNAITTGQNEIPPGVGGGCINSGPFKTMTVNLGPVAPTLAEPEVTVLPPGTGFTYNPRCIKRDISEWVSSKFLQDNQIANLITQNKDIDSFQTTMQGNFAAGLYGVHTAGHFTYQGDPAGDLFASPGDPMFFLHHGMIDRTWWTWQNQDITGRLNQISGTITINNTPPSRNGTLNDIVDLGVLGVPPLPIKSLVSTTGGPFCYIYA